MISLCLVGGGYWSSDPQNVIQLSNDRDEIFELFMGLKSSVELTPPPGPGCWGGSVEDFFNSSEFKNLALGPL